MASDFEVLTCGPNTSMAVDRRSLRRAARAGATTAATTLVFLTAAMDASPTSTLETRMEPKSAPPVAVTGPVAGLVRCRLATTTCHPKQTSSCCHREIQARQTRHPVRDEVLHQGPLGPNDSGPHRVRVNAEHLALNQRKGIVLRRKPLAWSQDGAAGAHLANL